ncbi:lipocalin family protein [Phenylobacterium soli]|uniref:Outer membrane lipoprotein Blc n=1 Tax=Phenylobacterium soli TaxID=2170551 RepID=A0A328AGV9_9CAUL|nr:lipocalin family protein [Phenylobacterium soli]RAK53346.1 lipocalin [Phenylobacterium soli]
MLKRFILSAAALAGAALSPALATPAAAAPAGPRIELTQMMGRWYEVARIPNQLQKGCQAGASDWTRAGDGFAVVQSCHKGAPDGPVTEWKARARSMDPATNSIFKMSFFGGLVTREYRVLDHRPEQGWLILSTDDGKYLWLMSQKPTLTAAVRAQALARIKQLGFDVGRLEFPLPARS